eukprot:s701_g1.t1
MNEYHRAEEGTEKRKYDFLVSAVRRHLDRERLETNRERVARNLSGAVTNSLKGIPAVCSYECDTEFGCDYCIPKGIVAAPAESREMDPYFVKPDGKIIPLTVNDYVPYLAAKPGGHVAAAVKRVARREAVPVTDVELPRDGDGLPDVGIDDLVVPEGRDDRVVDLVSDDENEDFVVETPREIIEGGEMVPVTPPNIDDFVAEMEELGKSDKGSKGLATDDPYMEYDVERTLEDQDAKPVREPEPNVIEEPVEDADDKIEVINPKTGEIEKISKSDPTFYDTGGFKARRYKDSSKPLGIPPFVWQSMSVKARREAIREEQMKIAAKEAEKKLKARSEAELKRLEKKKPGVASIINQLTHAYENPDEIPIMPTCAYSEQRHRVKLARVSIQSGERAINTLVARPVNRKEIRANPKAQEALDVEWNKLGYFVPDDDIIRDCELSSIRHTDVMDSPPEGDAVSEWDQYLDESGHLVQGKRHANMWVGTTYLFSKHCKDPKAALASIKRDKGEAKKKARAQGFSYMDQLFPDQPCMKKPN